MALPGDELEETIPLSRREQSNGGDYRDIDDDTRKRKVRIDPQATVFELGDSDDDDSRPPTSS